MLDTRRLLARIVNPAVPWFVAVARNAIAGVALVLLASTALALLGLVALWGWLSGTATMSRQ